MRALYTAATGMAAQELSVQVISNNIANLRTTGYKKQRAQFQDLIYEHVQRVGAQASDQGTVLPVGIDIGGGVKTVGTPRLMTQGTLNPTGGDLDIAIRGDAVRAHHHAADATRLQEVACHIVRDQCRRNAVLLQFPNGEPRSLQEWPCLIGEDVNLFAGCRGGAHHTQRGAVACRRQGARVAMRQDRLAVRHQHGAVPSDGFVDGNVFQADLLRFGHQPGAQFHQRERSPLGEAPLHPIDRPEQIDCRRPGCGQRIADVPEFIVQSGFLSVQHPDGDAHGRGDSDGGSAADNHRADRVRYVQIALAYDICLFEREPGLVNHHHASVQPLNRLYHFCGIVPVCEIKAKRKVRL